STRARTQQRAAARRPWAALSAIGIAAAIVTGGMLAGPAAAAAPPPAGVYEGTAVQTIAGGNELDDPYTFDLTLEVGSNGRLTSFDTEYWWVCATVPQTGFSPFDPVTGTPLTAGVPFATDASADHEVEGVVTADGT